jgi:hypothetical protein
MVDRLPHDVKASIASFLSGDQLKQLALVNRAWRAAGESHLMSRLHVPPLGYAEEFAKASWAGLRQLLESQPSRIPSIKEIKAGMIYGSMSDRNAILRMVSPYLTTWTEVHSCTNHSSLGRCDWAGQSHLLLAMQPMPALKKLTIHVDGSWSLTLPNLLRVTPKLTNLCLRGETTDQVLSLPTEIWPKLDNLTTLSVEHHRGGLLTTLPHAMLPLCGNLRTFNLKLLSLTLSDMGNFKIYVQPIRTALGIENVSIDCPGEDVDNVALYDELFSELDDAYDEEDTDEVEDSKWLGMKRLNVTGDVSQTSRRI